MDTIGSKYPFFFRNGDVSYKEIPVGGLISYHVDDLMLFDKSLQEEYFPVEMNRISTKDKTSFRERTIPDEFYLERKYKH
jgi:hypothetical protein